MQVRVIGNGFQMRLLCLHIDDLEIFPRFNSHPQDDKLHAFGVDDVEVNPAGV
jgi:hypothetical protein